jgi:hypothetical protein
LADGLDDATHELVLTVGAAGGSVVLDGLRVRTTTGAAPTIPTGATALGLLAALLAVQLLADVRRAVARVRL